MTPTPFPYDEHPDVSEISALGEGVLPAEREPAVREHLAECELCAEVRNSLEEIRETLGTLPGPVRMPEDVASRIDAALAAEALLDSTTREGDEAVSRETAPGEPSTDASDATGRTTTTAVSRETASASSAAPSDAGSAADADPVDTPASPRPRSGDRPPGHAPGGTGPRGPGGGTGPGRGSAASRRSRRRRRAVLAAVASVAALALGGITFQALSGDDSREVASDTAKSAQHPTTTAPSRTPETRVPHSGTEETGEDRQLRKHVQHLLSEQPTHSPGRRAPSPSTTSGTPSPDTKRSPSTGENTLRDDMTGGQTLPSCVRDGIRRAETPLAVDPDATFAHRSGYLVVLPHQGGDTAQVDAYLVDPSCIDADPSGPGKVLFKGVYPRG